MWSFFCQKIIIKKFYPKLEKRTFCWTNWFICGQKTKTGYNGQNNGQKRQSFPRMSSSVPLGSIPKKSRRLSTFARGATAGTPCVFFPKSWFSVTDTIFVRCPNNLSVTYCASKYKSNGSSPVAIGYILTEQRQNNRPVTKVLRTENGFDFGLLQLWYCFYQASFPRKQGVKTPYRRNRG